MKNIYQILKYSKLIKNYRIKSFGVYLLHRLGKRYMAIHFDPVLACNLRCQMCYFSDEVKRKSMHGVFQKEHLPKLADALFHRALKLQIGCGAEPSLYKYNREIILLARQKGVPYISYTTNGNLLDKNALRELFEAGLNEITLSMHGVCRETYERLMVNASYDRYHAMLSAVTELKSEYPDLQLRINYTINNDNLDELADFFTFYGHYAINVIQLRPIQKMGETAYSDFSIDGLIRKYAQTLGVVVEGCHSRDITCLAPSLESLTNENNTDSMLVESTYCYISPKYIWRSDFDFMHENFDQYAGRTKMGKSLMWEIFRKRSDFRADKKNLNYSVS